MKEEFNVEAFYKEYSKKVMLRPGYPARAQYKSTLMWDLYGGLLKSELGIIHTYADIGGCFGFGANAMGFQISQSCKAIPETYVFEIESDFLKLGRQLFPYINFVEKRFETWTGSPLDLVTLFDVIEHIPAVHLFLPEVAKRCQFGLLMTPMETKGKLRRNKKPDQVGKSHPDGHINFFYPSQYNTLLKESGFEIIKEKLVYSIVPRTKERILCPEEPLPTGLLEKSKHHLSKYIRNPYFIPFSITRKLFGYGKHLCLVKSCYH